ncbi:helix-turn-helix domain-containing protein [Chryseosolibacter indicus]|uniref:Chromosomal replication initiator DnaA C-terminal domain-containing protein n=1 Tax=Chryseosolibacter indicus TaxID=2782351 RepID=A0ABS5VN99_9BACT|nr:helix-turn-helix domain-containing protein [Chryseosolibacter indicus]MBT1702927.1 hypothetical protein [Chryseosolibacter indicus]
MRKDIEAIRVRVLNMVADAFGCSVAEIKGSVKKKTFSDARCVYSYIMRHQCGESFMSIGLALNKDHSTVVEQIERMNSMIFTKEEAAHKLKKIERELLKQN